MLYYTEYPTSKFTADTDEAALATTSAQVVYRENQETVNGTPFVILRDEHTKESELDVMVEESFKQFGEVYKNLAD